ncbi:TIM barrel protein [Variovorax dokdonensis]|uniref:TIM barrel protein n=1 Tax=Variovorax dokdonensis TaxID=344883 RepID=A0ABT7NE26_9BURK|nr:TIM barrel protein [Variovorax dokdonensis]MDM0046202.1 TIM barrel protein [Variovorax dokdonensis]
MFPVYISLGAFGAAEVGRHGQPWFARLASEAGADGVEVRGELLHDTPADDHLHAELGLLAPFTAVYSEPMGLWTADGELDGGALQRGFKRAAVLGAPVLKMSIGGFRIERRDSLNDLSILLADAKAQLLIENDQTETGGTLGALQAFFAAADDVGLSLGMTFDMGNWHHQGESPLEAAKALAPRVRYVHCKGAQRLPNKWIAVPLGDSIAPWRAVLRALPGDVPHAIEYPLAGNDLLATTRDEIALVKSVRALA